MYSSQANNNAPKKVKEGEPNKRESGQERQPSGAPLQDDQEGQRGAGGGGERGLPAKEGDSTYPAI